MFTFHAALVDLRQVTGAALGTMGIFDRPTRRVGRVPRQ